MENANFVDTFWGVITKLDYFLGSFLCIYRSFLSSMYRTEIFFVGCLFVVVFVFWGVWGVNSRLRVVHECLKVCVQRQNGVLSSTNNKHKSTKLSISSHILILYYMMYLTHK